MNRRHLFIKQQRLRLKKSLESIRYKLYDPENYRFVTFKEAAQRESMRNNEFATK